MGYKNIEDRRRYQREWIRQRRAGKPGVKVRLRRTHKMNWFERHLNWTWVLSYLALLAGSFIVGVIIGSTSPDIGDADWNIIESVINIIGGISMLIISG